MQQSKHSERGVAPQDRVQHPRGTARIGQPVSMDRQCFPLPYLEAKLARMVHRAQVPLPEVVAPAIVVATHNRNRHPLPQLRQRRRYPEPMSRHDVPVAEPEVEQVAVDQQRVPQRRHRPEEPEEGIGYLGRGSTQVRVGNGYHSGPKHATKIMFLHD